MKFLLTLTAVVGLTAPSLAVRPTTVVSDPHEFMINHSLLRGKNSTKNNIHNPARQTEIERINRNLLRADASMPPADDPSYPAPDFSFGPTVMSGDIDGPNGEVWYYTAKLINKPVKYEYFTDYLLREYSFTIYDNDMKEVGTIHDKMRYEGNEIRVPDCSLLPVITRNYFNDDDKYEVIIGMAINTAVPGVMHDRTYVYSLGGEKETLEVEDVSNDNGSGEQCPMVSKEFDKPIYRLDGMIADVLDASKDGNEEFYFTVYGDYSSKQSTRADSTEPDDDIPDSSEDMTQEEKDKIWENMTRQSMAMSVLGKIGDDGKLRHVLTYRIPMLSMPGDQESSLFQLSIKNESGAYFVISYYKEPFWNPYYTILDPLTMRESNSLMIDVYKVENYSATKVQTTEIPFVKDNEASVLATYMSVGDFRYRQDVNFTDFTTDGRAAFYITQNNYGVGEQTSYSFYIYGPDGGNKPLVTLFRGADSALGLSDIEGQEPQELFVEAIGGMYYFSFVDLISGKKRGETSYLLTVDEDSDPERMTANIDRTPVGDSYQYAVELRVPIVDDNENDLIRIAWLDDKLNYIKTDHVNLGTNVFYASVYIDGKALNPDIFYKDDQKLNEYLVLIKRGLTNGGTTEELLVGQGTPLGDDSGKTLLLTGANERGALRTIFLYADQQPPTLVLYRSGARGYTLDTYNLPFNTSAVTELQTENQPGLIDANNKDTDGIIYNFQGIPVGKDLDTLPAGLYILNGHKILKTN